MKKLLLSTVMLAFVAMIGQAKDVVWEQPTIEYGTSNGDGFFNLVLDVTKVELKDNETVVYITALQRSDYPEYSFQFAGDTYLKVGEQRYTVVSADGIDFNKFVQTNKDGKRDMAFHFPPLPKGTKVFDFIEGDGDRAFQIKGIKPVEERWKLEDSLLRGLRHLRLQVLGLQAARREPEDWRGYHPYDQRQRRVEGHGRQGQERPASDTDWQRQEGLFDDNHPLPARLSHEGHP